MISVRVHDIVDCFLIAMKVHDIVDSDHHVFNLIFSNLCKVPCLCDLYAVAA